MAQAILPSNIQDPTGQDRRERACIAEFSRRVRRVRQVYVEVLRQLPHTTVTVNADRTDYDAPPELLTLLLEWARKQVNSILLDRVPAETPIASVPGVVPRAGATVGTPATAAPDPRMWLIEAGVEPAYAQGTAQQVSNLTVQSREYALTRPNIETVINSPPYRTRLELLRERVSTSLKGFAEEVSTRMSLVLQGGLAVGKNPLAIADDLAQAAGVSQSKAQLIARTEVPGALRAARLAEADQAAADLGLVSLEMHLSACSPTTRQTHYARMGTLHTTQEQREWWDKDGNRYNCKCSTVTVLLDENGKPRYPGVITRAMKIKADNPLPTRKV